jgi:hypothetical protein
VGNLPNAVNIEPKLGVRRKEIDIDDREQREPGKGVKSHGAGDRFYESRH